MAAIDAQMTAAPGIAATAPDATRHTSTPDPGGVEQALAATRHPFQSSSARPAGPTLDR